MATKPTAVVVWATNTLYAGGPAVGLNTKEPLASSGTEGFVPDTGIAAEFVNKVFNELGLWSAWLLAGANLPTLDAHIVETNGTGQANIASVNVGGTAASAIALAVQENSGSSDPAMIVQNTVGDRAILAQVTGGSGTGVDVSNSGTGYCFKATQSSDVAATQAPVNLSVRNTEPTTTAEGDQFFRGDTHHRPGFFDGGEWRYTMGSSGGFIRRYANAPSSVNTNASPGYITVASATLQSADFPVATTTVHVRGVVEVGADIVGNIIRLILDDSTSAVVISEGDAGLGTDRFVRTFQGSGAPDERYVTIEADYVLPAAGARSFRLRIGSDGGNLVYARFASLEVTGAF